MRFSALLLFALVVFGGVMFGPRYLEYEANLGLAPAGVHIGGIAIDAVQTPQEAAELLRRAYELEPVAVYFDDERITLRPRDVGFQVDVEQSLAEAQAFGEGWVHWLNFGLYALEQPPRAHHLPLRYTLDEAAVARWLEELAGRYDRPPAGPRLVQSELRIVEGRSGLALAVDESLPHVLDALENPWQREAQLVLVETPPLPGDISILEQMLEERAKEFPGIVSIFVRDIERGEEAGYNPEVAFSGMSTIKVLIVQEVYRRIDGDPDEEMANLIAQTMRLSGNYTANLLLRFIGDGDAQRGADRVTELAQRLGLRNTFMATPYDQEHLTRVITTPANSDRSLDTTPDRHMQTTAKDMGLLVEMVYQCTKGGGTFMAAYRGQVQPEECQATLDWMEQNKIEALIEEGIPPDIRIAHKHGFVPDSHGDVAIIWGPRGPYILSIFLFRPTWLEWDYSTVTMRDISALVYNYFEFMAEQDAHQ